MEINRLSDLLWRTSPNYFFLSVILGVISGLGHVVLVPLILYAVETDRGPFINFHVDNYNFFNSPTAELAIVFLIAIISIIIIRSASLIVSMYIANNAAKEHRKSLYRRVMSLAIEDVEKIGHSNIINILNVDIPNITKAAVNLPIIWVNLVSILGVLAYLLYFDLKIFTFVIVSLIIAIISYQLPSLYATGFLIRAREFHDQIQEGVRGLVLGAKELKLNKIKANNFQRDDLALPEDQAFTQSIRGLSVFIFSENYGMMITFLVIAVVVFQLPYVYVIDSMELFGIVMALLYLTGPIGMILSVIGEIQAGKVSLRKLNTLYSMIIPENTCDLVKISNSWNEIKVINVTYSYKNSIDRFSLTPISLNFKKGQISFIVGGNGSGKSTLSKCLSLHYSPNSGALYFDDQLIDKNNIESARQQISAIYSDFYLFKKIEGVDSRFGQERVNQFLKYLDLDGKVRIENNVLNTTALSDGQKRRLALLNLLLENRDICIFDEWAADQDPRFKELFYSNILHDLKLQNKLIIVISHDDRYFKYADQLIYMESGRVKKIDHNSNIDTKAAKKSNNMLVQEL